MKTIHLGHHFYGAGNLGDDFMLAGFLAALAPRSGRLRLTCCVPHPRGPLSRRFPQVDWRPYDEASRRESIDRCDAWLGLGGSPFQSAVSDWFAVHLEEEWRWCAAAGRPMYFLGVGGQDAAAYASPALRAVAAQAAMIWTRDPATAAGVAVAARPGRVKAAADLAHLYFAAQPPPPTHPGRLTAVLNFDYGSWPGAAAALSALAELPAADRVWLSQESRPLPGAEQTLFSTLPPLEQARWRLELADTPGAPLAEVLGRWPSGHWLLTSRFHATLAGAWSGSRAVVIATNEKLRAVAAECGYPAVDPAARREAIAAAFQSSAAPATSLLQARAASARQACEEFATAVGL